MSEGSGTVMGMTMNDEAAVLFNYFANRPLIPDLRSDWVHRAPKGFRRIGAGSFRVVFRSNASGIVYKIDLENMVHGFERYSRCNLREWANYLDLKDAVLTTCRIPQMWRFDFGECIIIAAEYVDGRHIWPDDVWNWGSIPEYEAIKDETGLGDIQPLNMKYRKGDSIPTLIDIEM